MLASFMFIANNKMYNEMFARNHQQSNLVVIIEFRLFIMLMILISLAHLSRRLIGELIGYSWSAVRRPQCSKISETAGPFKAKFYVEPPWVGGTIFYS